LADVHTLPSSSPPLKYAKSNCSIYMSLLYFKHISHRLARKDLFYVVSSVLFLVDNEKLRCTKEKVTERGFYVRTLLGARIK
jgi:hypothetical protein